MELVWTAAVAQSTLEPGSSCCCQNVGWLQAAGCLLPEGMCGCNRRRLVLVCTLLYLYRIYGVPGASQHPRMGMALPCRKTWDQRFITAQATYSRGVICACGQPRVDSRICRYHAAIIAWKHKGALQLVAVCPLFVWAPFYGLQ